MIFFITLWLIIGIIHTIGSVANDWDVLVGLYKSFWLTSKVYCVLTTLIVAIMVVIIWPWVMYSDYRLYTGASNAN